MSEQWLRELAEAVSDGMAVDWNDAAQRATDERTRAILNQLRVIAAISSVHSTITPSDLPVDLGPPSNVPDDARKWGSLAILDEIGVGSYGRVYRAIDLRLHREVALKLVRQHAVATNLVAEARLLARVRHPHVVTVYGADMIGDEVGLWMELLSGRTLAAHVAEQGPYSADEAAIIGSRLCSAVSAVHHAGLLHRDIKAQNVMREDGGRIVLMDFGASHDTVGGSADTRPTGTPLYLAPEILEGGKASTASDIYSLGALLFFLVSGRFPVEGFSLNELRQSHRTKRRLNLRDLRPDVPESFAEVVEKAIAPNAADRYATCGNMGTALASVLDTRPITPPAPLPQVRPSRWKGSHAAAAVAAAIILALIIWFGAFGKLGAPPSLAVIPLRSVSPEPGREYLAEGLTDALITKLTRIDGLRVLSYAAVTGLQQRALAPVDVGKQLGVRYILAGAVLSDGPNVRTTVQLHDVQSGTILWAEEYQRTMSDLLRQQADIVAAVASKLRIDVAGAPIGGAALQTSNPEAHDAYLRGLAEESSGRMPDAAISHFERAVALEPRFADAWANLALARIRLANQDTASDRDGEYARARDAATMALAHDAHSGRAYTALGTINFNYDWDWSAADDNFRRALEAAPGDAMSYQRYANFLAAHGRLDEAIDLARQAQTMEPLVPARTVTLAIVYYYARRYEEADREYKRALDFAPGYSPALLGMARLYEAMGRLDDAMTYAEKAVDAGNALNGNLAIARLHALRQDPAAVDAVLKKVAATRQGVDISPDHLAYVYAALGDFDRAFASLDAAADRKAGNLLWIKVDPRFDALRHDPRFTELLNRLRLP